MALGFIRRLVGIDGGGRTSLHGLEGMAASGRSPGFSSYLMSDTDGYGRVSGFYYRRNQRDYEAPRIS